MKAFFVLDDATLGVHEQRDWETPGGVSPIAECMFMGQKYEIGVAVVSHTVSALSAIISQNIRAWLVTGLPGEDARPICNLLATSPEQAEELRTALRCGQFVCLNPTLWPKPVRAEFARPQIPGLCDEAMQQAVAANFLAAVITKPPAPLEVFRPRPPASVLPPTKETPAQGLPAEQIEMLVIIASGLPKTAGKVYELMRLSRVQGVKVAQALETAGAIADHRFSTGKVGGQICFFEILDYGWTILQPRGLSKPAPLTKGGFEHELAAQLLKAEAIRDNLGIAFEVDLGGPRMDAALINKKTGQRIYCQIGISSPDHEVDSILKFFALPAAASAKFVLIARDAAFAKEVKKLFKTRKVADAIVRQVNIRVLADLVKE
jgi:hypothetical protein